jgi:hypothetical protein
MGDMVLDIPFVAPGVLKTLDKTHVNLRLTPNEDHLLAFSILVPNDWAYSKELGPVSSGPFETRSLGLIAGDITPGAPMIGITVTQSPFEIPVDTWLTSSLRAEGWTVVSTKWIPGPFGLLFDAVGTRALGGTPEIRRTTAHVDGSNIFCVSSFMTERHWEATKEILWVAHASFELLAGTKLAQMEPWLSARAPGLGFELAYPRSWSAGPVSTSTAEVAAVDVKLLDTTQEILMAYLQVRGEAMVPSIPPPRPEALLTETVSRLGRSGFSLRGALRPSTGEDDPRAAAVSGWAGGYVGKAHLGTTDLVMRLGFMIRDGASFSFALASPSIEDDTLVALRAQRAFEIARATLRMAHHGQPGQHGQ